MKTKVDPIKLTMDMVAIPSYSYMDRQEEAISQYILDFFLAHGVTAYRREIVPGRYNTFAILEGTERETSPSLLLTGHMDTVRLMILRRPSSRGKMRSMCTAEVPWI